MRKAFKIAIFVLAGVATLVGAFVAFVAIRGIPHYQPERVELAVESTPERVARGHKLAKLLCVGCHLDPSTRQLTGKFMADAPPEFGHIFSRNITRDPEHGIGSWSDAEIAVLLRTGIARDGRYIPPYMSKLPHLADEDLFSIIAFLRSDDPLVAPVPRDPPGQSEPSFLTKLLSNLVFKPLPFPQKAIPLPPESNQVAYGRYLVFNLDCWTCHSADFKTMNVMEPEKTPGYLGGGNLLLDLDHRVVRSANITFDAETGIGRWSKEDFVRAMRQGVRPDHRPVLYPMMPMPDLSDSDLSAIYAYLKTVPKLYHAVERAAPPKIAGEDQGKKLYYRYGCYGCHGDDGVGIADLRQAAVHFPTDAALIQWIRNAPSIKPGTTMPKWEGIIKDEEFPLLAAYVKKLGARTRTAAR